MASQPDLSAHPDIPEAVGAMRAPLDSRLSPHDALLLIRGEPWPFALTGRWAGGGAILGCDPLAIAAPGDDPLALLGRLPALRGGPTQIVGGGWFGWLGYGLGARIEDLPPQPPRPAPLAQAHLAFYDHVLRLDAEGRWWFEALVSPGRERHLERRLKLLRRRMSGRPTGPAEAPGPFRPVGPGWLNHLQAVDRCLEKIRCGEIFQANLALRLQAAWRGEMAALFARAAAALQPSYGALFDTPEGGIASMSPELFLRRSGRLVETRPIKGTIARPDAPGPARSALRVLRESAKDRAEHTMIVDVARNDLGRVCAFGSVRAPRTPEAEAGAGVWHLVSPVRGRLRAGAGDAELLRASFPPASVTGAPKIQAMRAIAELEPHGREVFTGAIGYASPAAGLELSVAIRTFEARGERLWLDVGGGIVADSTPAGELEECMAKALPLVAAAGSRIAPAPPAPTAAAAPGGAPRPALRRGRDRPDPAQGVLETILVREGRARRLDEHLERLNGSMELLYSAPAPRGLRARLAAAAAPIGAGALRIRARADGQLELSPASLPRRAQPVQLQPFTLPGGLGEHKWADRHLLEQLGADGSTPLLLDADGSVLEAAWGNLWIREGDLLLTPAADGRILPGVTRAAILRGGGGATVRSAEAAIDLQRLIEADAIFLSSSLAGLVPGRLCDAYHTALRVAA